MNSKQRNSLRKSGSIEGAILILKDWNKLIGNDYHNKSSEEVKQRFCDYARNLSDRKFETLFKNLPELYERNWMIKEIELCIVEEANRRAELDLLS
jgi:hypothetical protein